MQHKLAGRTTERDLRFEFAIPIKIVKPGTVQIIGRKQTAIAVQLLHTRAQRFLRGEHAAFMRQITALQKIAA